MTELNTKGINAYSNKNGEIYWNIMSLNCKQISSDELTILFGIRNDNITKYQKFFDILGENYFKIAKFLKISFECGFNPLPQLQNRWKKYEFSYFYPKTWEDVPDFSENDNEFLIIYNKEKGEVFIAPPNKF